MKSAAQNVKHAAYGDDHKRTSLSAYWISSSLKAQIFHGN